MQTHFTALSILVGFALVAGALYFSGTTFSGTPEANAGSVVRTEARHLYGNPDAEIVIVEFSDFQCPFCAKHHPTLKRIVDESDGNVAWEYRHLPLPNHPLADDAARAVECVAKHRGNDAFWQMTDILFSAELTETYIKEKTLAIGVSESQYEACQSDPAIAALIDADLAAVEALGLNSTPSNVILYPDNTIKTVPGALPYEQFISLLE